jgi:hypothetical protein
MEEIPVKCLVALAFAAPLLAQTTLPGGLVPTTLPVPQTFTTGMVGFTTNQTARLNVFNLNSVVSTTSTTNPTPPANCTVELQFFDNKGAMVSQTTVPNFAGGASTSFDLPRASVTSETAVRAEIRGVVVINPTVTPAPSTAPGFCTVFTTLEIFDATGSTVALTSDTRPLSPAGYSGILFGPLNEARR